MRIFGKEIDSADAAFAVGSDLIGQFIAHFIFRKTESGQNEINPHVKRKWFPELFMTEETEASIELFWAATPESVVEIIDDWKRAALNSVQRKDVDISLTEMSTAGTTPAEIHDSFDKAQEIVERLAAKTDHAAMTQYALDRRLMKPAEQYGSARAKKAGRELMDSIELSNFDRERTVFGKLARAIWPAAGESRFGR